MASRTESVNVTATCRLATASVSPRNLPALSLDKQQWCLTLCSSHTLECFCKAPGGESRERSKGQTSKPGGLWGGLSKDKWRRNSAAETISQCSRWTAVFLKDLEGPAETWKDLQRPGRTWKSVVQEPAEVRCCLFEELKTKGNNSTQDLRIPSFM